MKSARVLARPWALPLAGLLWLCGACLQPVLAQPAVPQVQVPALEKKVLVLATPGVGSPGVDQYVQEVLKGLMAGGLRRGDIYVEYLSLDQVPPGRLRAQLAVYLKQKYATVPIDLMFVAQQGAVNFLFNEGRDLAPGVPLIIVYGRPPEGAQATQRKIYTLSPMLDYRGTLERALELFPQTRRVVVLTGSSEIELARLDDIYRDLAPWNSRLAFENTKDLSLEDILAKVAHLPPDTIVLGGGIIRDAVGHNYIAGNTVERIAKQANAPVFVLYDLSVGRGTTGGMVLRIVNDGALAAETALSILGGTQTAPAAGAELRSKRIPYFDWQQIERWGGDREALPPDTVFVNRPPTLWGEYKEYVVLSATVVVFLLLLVVMLLVQRSRRRATAQLLRESEERFRILVEHAPEAILVYDADTGRFIDANPNAERLFGCSKEELLQGGPERFYTVDGEAAQALRASVDGNGERALGGLEVVMQRDVFTADGRRLVCEVHLVRLPFANRRLVRSSYTDVTERKLSEAKIEQLAFYDPLTGLPNRRLLLERLQRAVAACARTQRRGALLYLDLDNFKTLNDTMGHDMGDLLLQEVARRLRACVREVDTAARLGGDEFVVMLEDLSADELAANAHAVVVAEKILATLEQPYALAGKVHRSTASVGVTVFGDAGKGADDLLKSADLAMYEAKAAGRNALRVFNPDMQAAVSARAELESDLRKGLQQAQFLMYLQPQVEARGIATGAEALLRWQHPVRGMVSPMDFIPVAEETGLIVAIGEWILETACLQLVEWQHDATRAHLTLAVNVSVRQFRHEDFVDRVLAILQKTGANPQRLKLELTESLLVADVDSTIDKMAQLKAHGLGFALDDFGTGYSSLAYLKRLPLDQLKIDQSFVRDILNDPNDAAIARTVIALAQSMGLAVIAEGVENQGQWDFLATHGCKAYQGFLFARPMAQSEFNRYLQSNLS